MGLSNWMSGKVEKRSHKILCKEVAKVGGNIEDLEIIELGKKPGFFKVMLVSQFGGDTNAGKVRISRITVDGTAAVFVRPFAGAIMHPGEIHAILPGTVSGAIVRTRDGWHGDAGPLATSTELAAALKKFSWVLRTHLIMSLPWAIQLRPLGDGTSQLAMLCGSYAGLFSVTYGVSLFRDLVSTIRPLLGTEPASAAEFLEPAYGDLALCHLRERDAGMTAGS